MSGRWLRGRGLRVWAIAACAGALVACDDGSGSARDGADAADGVPAPSPSELAGADAAVGGDPAGDAGSRSPAGADAGAEDAHDRSAEPCIDPEPTSATGRVYADLDLSDHSQLDMDFTAGVDTPLVGVAIDIVGAPGASTQTCADGRFVTPALAPGAYVVAPHLDASLGCSSRNCPRRFPWAASEGHVVVLTIGDSVPVVGASHPFSARLADLLSPLATVEDRNVAVPGTTSPQWVPGTSNFEQSVRPNLPAADVVLISLGGNDMLSFLSDPSLLSDLPAAVEQAKALVLGIAQNVEKIADAIRLDDPDVDIVYCLYPDYSQAVNTFPWSLVGPVIGPDTLGEVLEVARDAMPRDGHILLADLYSGAKGLPLDDYLADQLHFNGKGHTLYAELIFETLGGVLVGPSPLRDGAETPLGLDRAYSTTAAP